MPRVRFSKDFDFHPKTNVILAYLAGKEYLVSQECARQALTKGVGKIVPSPGQSDDNASR